MLRLNAIKEVSQVDVSFAPNDMRPSGRSSLDESMASDNGEATPTDTPIPKPLLTIQDDKLIATGSLNIHTSTSRYYREIRTALNNIDEHKNRILIELQLYEQEKIANPQILEFQTVQNRNSVDECLNIGFEEELPRSRLV